MDVITLSAKTCMAHLLLKETFDQFSFIEGEITTFNKFTLDGFLQKDFFDDAPTRSHSYWKEVRELCFWYKIRGILYQDFCNLVPGCGWFLLTLQR